MDAVGTETATPQTFVFPVDQPLLVVVADGSPNDSELFHVHQAIIRCPTGAITVDDV